MQVQMRYFLPIPQFAITREIDDIGDILMNDEKPNGKRVMTAQEVSEHLRIPLSTLYGLSKKGKIPGIKLGKHWRYLESDIVSLWRNQGIVNGTNGGEE